MTRARKKGQRPWLFLAVAAGIVTATLAAGLGLQQWLAPVEDTPPVSGFTLLDEQGQELAPAETAKYLIKSAADEAPAIQGWAAPQGADQKWAAGLKEFELDPPVDEAPQALLWRDNTRANVRLWKSVEQLSDKFPPGDWQETGDCTAWGACSAMERTQGSQIAAGGDGEFKRLFQPWQYGAGRVWVWQQQDGIRRLPSAGCSGAAVARSAQQFGVLPYDTPGLPKYSGALADEWGRKGPPEEFKAIAARHKVRTIARVTTLDQARDAICNGYGISIASDWGNPRRVYQRVDGRWVGSRTGQWSHQMCLDGYDGTGSEPLWHIHNSWPVSQHPMPIDDSPAGGFWVRDRDVAYILGQQDSYAFSDFEGFPVRDLDWSPILPRRTAWPARVPGRRAVPLPGVRDEWSVDLRATPQLHRAALIRRRDPDRLALCGWQLAG